MKNKYFTFLFLFVSFALTGCPQSQTPKALSQYVAQESQYVAQVEAELRTEALRTNNNTEALRTNNLGKLEHWDGSRWWPVVDLNSFYGVGNFKMDRDGRGWLWTGTESIRCRYVYVGKELFDNERRLVSPNGSANGPWINADKYVSEQIVTNYLLSEMARRKDEFEADMRKIDEEGRVWRKEEDKRGKQKRQDAKDQERREEQKRQDAKDQERREEQKRQDAKDQERRNQERRER